MDSSVDPMNIGMSPDNSSRIPRRILLRPQAKLQVTRSAESAFDVSPIVIRIAGGNDDMKAMQPGCAGCKLRGHLCVLCEIQGKGGRTDQILDISDEDVDDFPMAQARESLQRNVKQANRLV